MPLLLPQTSLPSSRTSIDENLEIHKNEIDSLPNLIRLLSNEKKQFIIFCDDLSFEYGEQTYKALKSLLDGGIEKKSDNILFYATSNRRHLIARNIVENEKQNAIHGTY